MEKLVYLFFGGDTFIIKSKINQLIQKHEVDEFNISKYDMEEQNLSDALNDAATIPFMTDKKIVIIQNAYFLSKVKMKKELPHDLDALKRYVNDPVKETILIISAPYASLDERKAITKEVKNHATVTECNPLKKQDASNWIRNQLGKNNIAIDSDALEEFLKRVESNTEVLVSEAQKLIQYSQGMSRVNLDTIQKVITKNIEDNVYEITNMMLVHNRGRALEIYNDLIMYSEDPLRILGIIINKYREILHVKLLLKQGKDQASIARYYKASSGRAYYMIKNANTVKLDVVEAHLKRLEDIDYKIKTGQIDKRIGVELFILGT
jgi:DNA polymerase-3 subunit delta